MSLRDLESRPNEVTFLLKVSIYLALVAYGARLATSDLLVLQILGVLTLGLMFAHGVELQHQALHKQGFRNGKLNEIVGILLGLPMLVSFAGYQAAHLRHHKHLGTPANEEFFDYGDPHGEGGSRIASLGLWFDRLMMPRHYLAVTKNLWRALAVRRFSSERPEVSARMCRDYIVMLLAILTLGAASFATHASLILVVWVLPLVLVAMPVHALIEMPEHYQCDPSTTDVLRNTRTIESNVLMYWYTNGNNYHVEHHMMPRLPMDRLPDLHRAIGQNIEHCHAGYRDFYVALLRGRLAGPKRRLAGRAATR
ncbi:fatty acid desaturase family protein [Polyangium sorediatum]|uniref:Fatty acid desaturase n=1 Tax=Polyangium sorediatum TaxID=889274 RepID=A0ABT6NST3_9BACT|nr:fatty acid desaturase [Polyangium sorediatum]MDI1431391.1 fatty acid desaturase [Polyangium sorediatum]